MNGDSWKTREGPSVAPDMMEFQDEEPTKPDPPEKLEEVLERWRKDLAAQYAPLPEETP